MNDKTTESAHSEPAWKVDNPELQLGLSWRNDRRFRPRSSSRWLSPPQLIIAAYRQLVAGLFESFSDRRDSLETRANVVLAHPDVSVPAPAPTNGKAPTVRPLFPDGKPNEDTSGFWFDYVADLGDGFNATYSVAQEIAMIDQWDNQKQYPVDGGGWAELARGELLVMGGDEVYPLASESEYQNRTIGPYETACRTTDPGMALLAVPGNHDWYDGLTAFLNRFCSEQWIGGWKTRQSRSYWAAKVQDGWWLWGVDLALEQTPIDHHQLAYFRSVASSLLPNDRIILVTPKPAWLRDRKAWIGGGSPADEPYNPSYDQLAFFMQTTMDAWEQADPTLADSLDHEQRPHFAMVLAGDKHTYARYDNEAEARASRSELREANQAARAAERRVAGQADGSSDTPTTGAIDQVAQDQADATEQLRRRLPHVLCGGGGAYLSLPFHHAETAPVPRRWRGQDMLNLDLAKQWPNRENTNRLAVTSLWRILLRNWGFAVLLGSIYLFFARAVDRVVPAIASDPFAPALSWGGNISRYADAITSSWWIALLTIGLIAGLQARSHLSAVPRIGLAIAQTAIHLAAIAGCDALARWASNSGAGLSGDRWSALVLLLCALWWAAWGVYRWRNYGRAPVHVLLAPVLFGLAIYAFIYDTNTWSWFIPMMGISTIVGAIVFAATLLVSAYTFGDKENLVSVAVRETGWKSFLRIHIEGDSCKVWAVGLEKVPHHRLRFRTDGIENYDPLSAAAAAPAKYTPEVTTIYSGLRGIKTPSYDARVIDSWEIRRHPHDPVPQTTVDLSTSDDESKVSA